MSNNKYLHQEVEFYFLGFNLQHELKPDNELSNAQSWRWMLRDNQSHLWAHRSLFQKESRIQSYVTAVSRELSDSQEMSSCNVETLTMERFLKMKEY